MKDSTREYLKNEWDGCGAFIMFGTGIFLITVFILLPLSCAIG